MKHTTLTNCLGRYAKHIGWALVSSATLAFFAAGAMHGSKLLGEGTVEAVAEPMSATPPRSEAHESDALSGKDEMLQGSMGASSVSRDAESARQHEEEEGKKAGPMKSPSNSRARVSSIKRTKRIAMPPPPKAVDLNAPPSMFLSQDGASAPGALLSATVDPATGLGSRSAREYAEEAKKGALIDPSKMPSQVAEMVDLGGLPVYQPEKKVGVAVRPMFPVGVSLAGKFH